METTKLNGPLPATPRVRVVGYDKIDQASLTDVGVRRSHNQDSHAVMIATEIEQWRQGGHVFLVADGMGAHAVGELASELAATIIPHTYHKYAGEGAGAALTKAFTEANASIHARGQQNKEFQGMGTTTTALVLRPDGAWVGHVGDSRAYLIRDGKIEQLSFDHSLAWELARRQGVHPDELEGIPSNVIVRSLGPEPVVQVDVEGPHTVQDGDVFVLCSDGMSNLVSDPEIGAVVSEMPPAEASSFLVSLANLRGGLDNITVIVVRVGGVQLEQDPTAAVARSKAWWVVKHWPFGVLLIGILLSGLAVTYMAMEVKGGKIAFYLASLALMVGLGGLMFHHYRDKNKPPPPVDPGPPRIYREASCRVDQPLMEKLAKAKAAVEQWAKEKAWPVDWTIHQKHQELARRFEKENNLGAAYREYCRAMRPLTIAMDQQRNKAESFKPLWDKKPDVRCPKCHRLVPGATEQMAEVNCPTCGNTFRGRR